MTYYIRYINITLFVDIYHQRYQPNRRFINFQDEKLNCNSKLSSSMFVMDSDNIMEIICTKIFRQTMHHIALVKFHGYFEMMGMWRDLKPRIPIPWLCLGGNGFQNMGSK
jgi:hypothetical protein